MKNEKIDLIIELKNRGLSILDLGTIFDEDYKLEDKQSNILK